MLNYNYSVYRGHQLWTKTLTQVRAIRLVNELLKNGFEARYERIPEGGAI
jgi:hypothetical protein